MKKVFRRNIITAAYISILSGIISLHLQAQDSAGGSASSHTTTTTTQTTMAIQPWMWIVGGIVLLIIIIALLTGKNKNTVSSDKVTFTKTIERDSD
jgi:ABC-type Mn2+/Zn2+ transport system permease subunit